MAHVAAFSPASPKALAHHLGIAKATLSAVIDPLREQGLLHRKQHPQDRRRHELTLTRLGQQALVRGSPLDCDRVRRVLQRLSPARRRLAVDGLGALAAACRDLRGGGS